MLATVYVKRESSLSVGTGRVNVDVRRGNWLSSPEWDLSVILAVLMTSYRDFASDAHWDYLRPSAGNGRLIFEEQEPDLYELVVPADWPTKVADHFSCRGLTC